MCATDCVLVGGQYDLVEQQQRASAEIQLSLIFLSTNKDALAWRRRPSWAKEGFIFQVVHKYNTFLHSTGYAIYSEKMD